MPKYSQKWMCEAYKTDTKIRMAVWRLDEENDTVEIPLDTQVKYAKIIYPSKCDGKIITTENSIFVTLDRPNMAVAVEVEI